MPWLIFCYIRTLKTILLWTSDPLIPLFWVDPLSPGVCPFIMESQLLPPGLHTPSTFLFSLAIHSLPSVFLSRNYSALGHLIFPVCPWRVPHHPPSRCMSLEADISTLHKLGFLGICLPVDFSQQEAPAGDQSREGAPSFHQLPPS